MENRFPVYCFNSHQVQELCSKSDCPFPAGICSEERCQYSAKHRRCEGHSGVEYVIERLQRSATDYGTKLHELIVGTIDQMIKRLNILKLEYQGKYNSLSTKLHKDQRRLFELMENGPAGELKPRLVALVVGRPENPVEGGEIGTSLRELKQIVDRVLINQDKDVEDIRNWWREPEIIMGQKMRLDQELTHPSILINGDNLKKTSSNGTYTFSLLSPSISGSQSKKTRIKLVSAGIMMVGAARKNILVESKLEWPDNNSGLFLFGSNGHSYNSSSLNQSSIPSECQFSAGDVFQLQYAEAERLLKITNVTLDKSVTLNQVSNQEGDLCFCVGIRSKDAEWEVLPNQ